MIEILFIEQPLSGYDTPLSPGPWPRQPARAGADEAAGGKLAGAHQAGQVQRGPPGHGTGQWWPSTSGQGDTETVPVDIRRYHSIC